MMSNYKDIQNKLHVIDPQFAHILPAGSIQISDAEAEAIRAANTPQEPIQNIVTMRQARQALLQAGMLAAVNAAVAAGDEATKIAWEYSTEVQREFPLVQTMKASLGLTEAQLDDLFTLAASL